MSSGVDVTGLRETIRAFERYGAQVSDLKDAFTRIGNIVVRDAQARAPRKSGALAASIRPSKTKNKSTIRAGSARVPYAAVQEYGWPRRNIQATNFLHGAVERKRTEVITALETELDAIRRALGL